MTHAPNKCYYKPKRTRPRYWTAKKVAEVWCQAKADTGATEEEVIAHARAMCGWAESVCERERQLLRDILGALAAAAVVIALPESVFVRIALALARVIPASWLARMGVTRLLTQLPVISRELEILIARIRDVLRLPAP